MPDLSSYMPAPWQPGLAIIQCDPTVHGEPWPFAPRVILRRQLERLEHAGLRLEGRSRGRVLPGSPGAGRIHRGGRSPGSGGGALLRRPGPHPDVRPPDDGLPPHERPRMGPTMPTITRTPTGSSSRTFEYADPHDDGRPGHRVPLHDALAGRRGRHVGHLHAEAVLQSDRERSPHAPEHVGRGRQRALFVDTSDIRGLGMSAMGYSFIAGLLEHAQALTAVTCPTVNSYKRLASAAPNSGAAWSPVFATYGGNDRTHMLRVPDSGRVEDRLHRRIGQSVSDHQSPSSPPASTASIGRLNPGGPPGLEPPQTHRGGEPSTGSCRCP